MAAIQCPRKRNLKEKKNDDDSTSKVDSGHITAVFILSFVLLMTERHHLFFYSFDSFRVQCSDWGNLLGGFTNSGREDTRATLIDNLVH
jgi:hypothetical protein